MIRSLLVILAALIFLICFIPVLLIEWLIGKFAPHARDISSLRIVQGILKVMLFFSGIKLTVIGEENIPKDQAVLYVGNHRSYFDTIITYSRMIGPTGFVAKKEMGRYPILSHWMKTLHCLFLDREDLKQGAKTILTAISYVKSGISICIFPEGTRSKNDNELDLLPFHEGSFKIATKSGCPIIPMAISNSREVLETHMPRIKRTHVILEYGTPIDPNAFDRKQQRELGVYTSNVIKEMLTKNQELI